MWMIGLTRGLLSLAHIPIHILSQMSSFISINKASTILSTSSIATASSICNSIGRRQLRPRQILKVSLILLEHYLFLGRISTSVIPKIVEYLRVAAH